jgi:hypothetical protein
MNTSTLYSMQVIYVVMVELGKRRGKEIPLLKIATLKNRGR